MLIPSAVQLLDVWESGTQRSPFERAVALVSLSCPAIPKNEIEKKAIGQIDAELIGLRCRLFGSSMSVLANCGYCGECIEVTFDLADLPAPVAGLPDTVSVELDGYRIRCRMPRCGDLIAIANCQDAQKAKQRLLERCLLEFDYVGDPRGGELSGNLIEALAEEMQRADPQSDLRLPITCPSCQCESRPPFDILSVFWHELDVWARRVIREVHALASVYHWSERDILAMSPWRRQVYMEAAGV